MIPEPVRSDEPTGGEFEFGHAGEQASQGGRRLQAGERGARAVVDAVPEGEVAGARPGHVEGGGVAALGPAGRHGPPHPGRRRTRPGGTGAPPRSTSSAAWRLVERSTEVP
ncbi:hypothetical protein ABT317_31160 [Streptomyces carpinensis]|uniref:Uncharacterized protein n=1 Tax=Streptomyces carpinensis TaxID=66369 RepID=A0ABV1WAT1_9ACTN